MNKLWILNHYSVPSSALESSETMAGATIEYAWIVLDILECTLLLHWLVGIWSIQWIEKKWLFNYRRWSERRGARGSITATVWRLLYNQHNSRAPKAFSNFPCCSIVASYFLFVLFIGVVVVMTLHLCELCTRLRQTILFFDILIHQIICISCCWFCCRCCCVCFVYCFAFDSPHSVVFDEVSPYHDGRQIIHVYEVSLSFLIDVPHAPPLLSFYRQQSIAGRAGERRAYMDSGVEFSWSTYVADVWLDPTQFGRNNSSMGWAKSSTSDVYVTCIYRLAA